MAKYKYEGPVVLNGKCVANNWKGETWADSESKAKSNLTYQAKQACRVYAHANVSLPGKIKMI